MKPVRLVLTPTRHRRLNELIGLLVLACAVLLFLSLVSYHPTDPSFNTDGSGAFHNWIGPAGAYTSDMLLQIEGISAFFLPLLIGALGWTWMLSRPAGSPGAKLTGIILTFLFAPALFGLIPSHPHILYGLPIAGLTGRLVADLLVRWFNETGAWIVAITLVAAALYLSTTFSFNTAREWIGVKLAFLMAWRDRFANWRRDRAKRKELKAASRLDKIHEKEIAKARKAAEKAAKREKEPAIPVATARLANDERDEMPHRHAGFAETVMPEVAGASKGKALWDSMPRTTAPEPSTPSRPVEPFADPAPVAAASAPLKPQLVKKTEPAQPSIGERADTELKTVTVAPKNVSGFRLPSSTLLHRSDDPSPVREDDLRKSAQVLVEKCAEFDVLGQVVQINPGPVVTTFEFRPEAGIKYSRVTGLADDLCLATKAESILIERMAGKSTVGIQVPNDERETIWLRDIIESENFGTSRSKLTLAMGKDINGRIVTADLATMPHVLIAGSTGSGKSVAINAMIMSVLYKSTPDQVRLILVDPKRVELGMYEGIPHLFTPIIAEPKLAANALRNAVKEMERRLKLLASRSVRNIDQYNRLFDGATPSLFEDAQEEKPLPYIVIIIDELADLMMLDKANVEESITRLAQMARAVGIHLVLATQRPSVDVITGTIKANFPTRISFQVTSKIDSRTILGEQGAEQLLGQGDMLYMAGGGRISRVHGPFVSDEEVEKVVRHLKAQGVPQYLEAVTAEEPGEGDDAAVFDGTAMGMASESEGADLYQQAVQIVTRDRKASTSYIQRRLQIGYNRAASLMERMEHEGVVGQANHAGKREILVEAGGDESY